LGERYAWIQQNNPERDGMENEVQTFDIEQVHELVEGRKFGQLKAALSAMEIHELGDLLSRIENENELAIAFRMLPTEKAAEILAHLESDQQEDLLHKLSKEKVAEIINEMAPDDRTELLEEMPGQLAQKLLMQLRGDERKIADSLLAYPEDSIGRLMTPKYLAVRKDWTIDHVLRHIRNRAEEAETVKMIFVVDRKWRLVGSIDIEQVVLSDPAENVEEVMSEQVGCLLATDDQESAVDAFKKYDAIALPVVDSWNTLVGIVTFDDVMDLQEEESTEDMQKMAGMAALEDSYFTADFLHMLKKRLPWLVLLLFVETLAVMALKSYESLLALLAMFTPLINATAGNTGNQVAGLMIRGFAVKEIELSHWYRVFFREVVRGAVMGATLGLVSCGIVLVFQHTPDRWKVAWAVAMAMLVAVVMANVIGSMLPFIFKRFGIDPAITSGPFIAGLMDVSSIVIFFAIAHNAMNIISYKCISSSAAIF